MQTGTVKVKENLLLGSALKMKKSPVGFFKELEQTGSPVVNFRLAHMKCCYLAHPDAVAHVLQENHKNYLKGGVFYDIARGIFGNGLVFSNEKLWVQQRRIMNPLFHKKAIDSYFDIMVRHTLHLFSEWKDHIHQPVDAHAELNKLTTNIATETLFGSSLSQQSTKVLLECMDFMLSENQKRAMMGFSLPYWIPTKSNIKLKSSILKYDHIVRELINFKSSETGSDTSLIALLLSAKDEETGEFMSLQQIIDEVKVFFVAGTETSANALTWTMYLLAQHPEVEKELRAEIEQKLNGRVPTLEDLNNLPFTMQVLNEAMRVLPPAWLVSRVNIAEDEISGVTLKKNTSLFISPYMINRHPAFWPLSDKFDPKRFEKPLSSEQAKAYIPYGFGPRKCIGYRFANMELCTLLVLMIQNFHWSLARAHSVEPEFASTLKPKNGLFLNFESKQ